MKQFFLLLVCVLLLAAGFVCAAQADEHGNEAKPCRTHEGKTDSSSGPPWCTSEKSTCTPEMRGRCGKRRGDWYGASRPVADASEARKLLLNYFVGPEYKLSEVLVKKWGFRAEILDKDGKVVDRVMIDKRSGRIRSIY